MCGVSDQQMIDQDRLDIYEGLLAAIERHSEVSSIIVASADKVGATQAVKDLLGIADAPAVAVLQMQWWRLVGDGRRRLQDERDALRQRLDERA